jgi:hypothetical protein
MALVFGKDRVHIGLASHQLHRLALYVFKFLPASGANKITLGIPLKLCN